jgi:hypothetical protein
MNIKRLALASLAVFGVIFAYDFVLHGIILKTDYVVTGYLWRPPEEMGKYFGSLIFGQVLLSAAFSVIYAFLVGSRGCVRCGLIYGLLAGLLLCGPNFISFAVQPMPFDLIIKWTVARVLQMLLAGLVLGLVYRSAPILRPQTPVLANQDPA